MTTAEVIIEVQFYDTDSLGIIYYGNYYRYFEAGFLKLLKNAGYPFSEMDRRGVYLPATFSSCHYYAPSRVEQSLRIRTNVHTIGRASLELKHEVVNLDMGGKLVAEGLIRHACVSDKWKIIPLPDWLAQALRK